MTEIILDTLRGLHRNRCFAMERRKSADLALGAYLRMQLGWSRLLTDQARKKIEAKAARIAKSPADSEFVDIVMANRVATKAYRDIEKTCLKQMEKLARELPVWASFGKAVRGFGAGSLAVIIAEAGDLFNYPKKGHLWKRMGLAVIDGVRQGGLKKGASADAWIEHGYNASRRSRVWNIGDSLIKGNRGGKYRTLYLKHKAIERERAPDMTKLHAYRRAQRYMEKRLLQDLLQAWKRATVALPERAKVNMPASLKFEGYQCPNP